MRGGRSREGGRERRRPLVPVPSPGSSWPGTKGENKRRGQKKRQTDKNKGREKEAGGGEVSKTARHVSQGFSFPRSVPFPPIKSHRLRRRKGPSLPRPLPRSISPSSSPPPSPLSPPPPPHPAYTLSHLILPILPRDLNPKMILDTLLHRLRRYPRGD